MLEIINQHIAIRTKLPGPLVKSMGIGLIGAFTTVSAFSTESLSFLQSGRYGTFALYAGFDARRDSVRPCGVAEDGKACADEKAEQ